MRELDRLIRRAGGVLIRVHRGHAFYIMDGERITLHAGTKPNAREETSIRAQVRRILRRRQRASVG